MVKILIVISSIKKGGGAEKIAISLANELSKRGHEIYLFSFYKNIPEYSINEDIKIYYFKEKKGHYNLLKDVVLSIPRAKNIVKICKDNNIDIIIPFMEIEGCTTILSKVLFRNNVKILPTFHANPAEYSNNYFKRIIISILYSKADYVIAINNDMAKLLKHIFKLKNIKVVYNPHNIGEYVKLSKKPLPHQYKEIFKNSFVFINIGRLTEEKGQWFLIRAFKKVVEKYPNAKLIILGDGVLRNELKNLIDKLNLHNSVFLLGNQNNVFPFLKHSKCFVFSSLWEGLPNTLIEALSMNLPIISTDCKTGPREILCPELNIGENMEYPYFGMYGILLKPFEKKYVFKPLNEKPLNNGEKILSDMMIKIIENKNLRKKYANGIERAKKFDSRNIINKWEMLFRELKVRR